MPTTDSADQLRRLEDMVWDINKRLLWLEIQAGRPMSIIDRHMVEAWEKQRAEAAHADELRRRAYHEARAEADLTRSDEPIERFVRRMKAGAYDPPKPNGGD
jgi:hypothetical protein